MEEPLADKRGIQSFVERKAELIGKRPAASGE
jgi:hypothetical protein